MKATQFQRYFQNYLQKESAKEVQFSSLNREEKIEYLMSQLNDIDFSKMNIQTEKEVEIAKLSKDLRFELIEKAAKQGDLELIKNLSLNQGVTNVIISQPFEKCSISAQLNFLEKEYQNRFEALPENVQVEILGGDNFVEFIKFCHSELEKLGRI
jgi:hypothetical protein